MFNDFLTRNSVLPTYLYKDERDLLRNLAGKVIQPAQQRRELIEHLRVEGRSSADVLDERERRVRALEKELQRLKTRARPRSGA